jgi:dTDP-4-dehydrorhamnose reductase
MKILIMGGSGMFGHGLVVFLAKHFEVGYTVRNTKLNSQLSAHCFGYVDGYDLNSIISTINDFKPEVVINAIGVVKQKNEISPTTLIYLNSQLPYHLVKICELANAKLILLSTDCVFSGRKGNYREEDPPDAFDLYGRSKILGEISDEKHVLTIRTSTIGLELNSNKGLLEWFLSQSGTISGFQHAIYSGFPMFEFANVLKNILNHHLSLYGLYHISSDPISKYNLLVQLKEELKLKHLIINEDTNFNCNRSLNSDKFRETTKYIPPSWKKMLEILAIQIKESKGERLGSF